ncbi:MAG: hypothetical protein OXG84_08245, partial [Chloroflexi bacterium]|nr:hypothetical protein [Chloroflexota bacterium]
LSSSKFVVRNVIGKYGRSGRATGSPLQVFDYFGIFFRTAVILITLFELLRAQRKGFQLLFWGTALQFRSIFAH